jgi:3-oxoacyl-[acyl-carrier-protein] synthase-1
MKRVVVTGLGIVSSIGANKREVLEALCNGRSGIRFNPVYKEMGLRCHVDGAIPIDTAALIDKKQHRFMGDAAAYAYLAMQEAIGDAGLTPQQIAGDPSMGLIVGSGGASHANVVAAADTLRTQGLRKVGPYQVPRTMASTATANLATAFNIQGISYSISSACATSAHCIGAAYEQILLGNQTLMFAGGAEEVHWTSTMLFDAMGALTTKFNDAPQQASRPYDRNRDGFVFSGGGGILVLEDYVHAKARNARIYAELVGYGAGSDGYGMVTPSGEGAVRSMRKALASAGKRVDYINAHGTSTPLGDIKELEAIGTVFGAGVPPLSSTKALTGHALGAAGVHEAVYALLMLEQRFIAASANIFELDPAAACFPIVRDTVAAPKLRTVLSNSFGFGGTNAALIFSTDF